MGCEHKEISERTLKQLIRKDVANEFSTKQTVN